MARVPSIKVENTRFIFQTNFSGDPSRDSFGSTARKANLIIPTVEQAMELMEAGFNVKQTKPRPGEEEGFEPTFFVAVKVNYDTEWPPKVYLVTGKKNPVMLTEESIDVLDKIYVMNVNAILNPYYSERNRTWSLYIQTMYVEQDIEDDPFADRYSREDIPFV